MNWLIATSILARWSSKIRGKLYSQALKGAFNFSIVLSIQMIAQREIVAGDVCVKSLHSITTFVCGVM